MKATLKIKVRINEQIKDGRYWYKKFCGQVVDVRVHPGMDTVCIYDPTGAIIYKADTTTV